MGETTPFSTLFELCFQPDQANIKRWVPSKFKTLERADRFFWEFHFLVLTHQCWRIARSLNDLGVPPNSADLQLGLLKLGHSHSWLIFCESCWLMVALISNHKVGRFNLAIPKRRISIILNHGDWVTISMVGKIPHGHFFFFLTGVVNIPFFEDFEDIIPHFLFLCCLYSLYISPLLWKKNAALALVHMEPHLPSRTDMIFTVSYRRRFGSEMGGEERLTQENDRCQLLPHQMVELVFVCPYDYDSQIVVSVVSPGKTHRLRLPIARLPDIGQRLSDQVFPVPASSPRHDFLSEGHSSIQDATTSSYGCKPQPQRSRRYNKFWSFSYRTSPAKGPLFLRHFYGKIRLNNEFLVPYSWIMNTHHPQKSNQWKRWPSYCAFFEHYFGRRKKRKWTFGRGFSYPLVI